MVERAYELNLVFASLSDPTRRDILKRLSKRSMSVGEIAHHYKLTFAGIAKHLDVLKRAGLVSKTRQGKEQLVALSPHAFATANDYLENFEELWKNRLNSLDTHLKTLK